MPTDDVATVTGNGPVGVGDELVVKIRRAVGGAALLVLAAGCGPTPAAAPPPAAAAPVADTGSVTQVIDGDTFAIGPRIIRVLGIDACEAGTRAGGAATGQARTLLLAGPVTLAAEPGVDRDPSGRELRYVALPDGSDFGTVMVPATHTAVPAGRTDAAPAVVDRLRAADRNGRTCDPPAPATTTTSRTTTTTPAPRDRDGDGDRSERRPDVDVPDLDRPSSRSNGNGGGGGGGGRVGRDGDGDGLCNESTVPVPC